MPDTQPLPVKKATTTGRRSGSLSSTIVFAAMVVLLLLITGLMCAIAWYGGIFSARAPRSPARTSPGDGSTNGAAISTLLQTDCPEVAPNNTSVGWWTRVADGEAGNRETGIVQQKKIPLRRRRTRRHAGATTIDGFYGDKRGITCVVFSTEDKPYQNWQSLVLAYSFRKSNQGGCLARVVHTNKTSLDEVAYSEVIPTFLAPMRTEFKLEGDILDNYKPGNKGVGVAHFVKALHERQKDLPAPHVTNIVIVDPDVIFLKPLTMYAERGFPIAETYSYIDKTRFHNAKMLDMFCTKPDLVQNLGQPYVLHIEDLYKLAPKWVDLTSRLRFQLDKERNLGTRYADMWGYVIAAANLGLTHRTMRIQTQPDGRTRRKRDPYLFHYTYTQQVKGTDYYWNKRKWTQYPTELVPEMPPEANDAQKRLVAELNDALSHIFVGLQPAKVQCKNC
eukprot:TRINITY_DN5673_c0_g1_i1.p1 TRINITY_DN5673_c0_g1~~TRINITY_DN5673_c0_g1_i1.p1  ORF type:complete len:448 (-),score=65.13 TRINITY_DN5673_c0_g1_i1:74-1417(-)